MKFKDSDEPFTKLLEDYKKRGGSANDFISAMYSVGRNAHLSSFERRLRDILPSSSDREVEDDVAGCAGELSLISLPLTKQWCTYPIVPYFIILLCLTPDDLTRQGDCCRI